MKEPSEGQEAGTREQGECVHLRDMATCEDCAKSGRIARIKASMWLAVACAVVFAMLFTITW